MKTKLIDTKLPKDIVKIHNEAFPGFFLTSLGPKFLELYYNTLLKHSNGIMICLYNESNKLLGFAAGTKLSKGFHGNILMDNLFAYVWELILIVITRPKAIFRLIKNMNKNNNSNEDDGNYAELLSIAIPPEYGGLGYGKILLRDFEKELKSCDLNKLALTTDLLNNDNVLGFYRSMNYEVFHEFEAYPNRKMYKLIKKI